MCGIFCAFSESESTEKLYHNFQDFSYNIGSRGPNHRQIESFLVGKRAFLFASSVLWLQGDKVTKQPIIHDNLTLVYNGDIFNDENEKERNTFGDTNLFLDYFKTDQWMYSLLNTNGPFAFVCFDKNKSVINFGRDKYGRRSLLLGKSNDGVLIITSVARKTSEYKFIEIPSIGIFSIDFKTDIVTVKPWFPEYKNFTSKIKDIEEFLGKTLVVEEAISTSTVVKDFDQPSEIEMSIFQFQSLNISGSTFLGNVLSNNKIFEDTQELKKRLENSVRKRITGQPQHCQNCIYGRKYCNHSVVGILFSGGVDCAILALLAHKYVPMDKSIDLLNVAFSENNDFNTPDRITGIQTFRELEYLCPERKWNFVEIDVTTDELNNERGRIIAGLIYPLNTILDDSLGCALWFASRGETEGYKSPCRVLLVGTGADELFGGYTRHKAAFKNGNWIGLHNVLKQDWDNLPYRNLGRDDRVVSDHARQLRTPYLDEDVVQFVQNLNCWEKTYPLKDDIGPKFLLRALAYHLQLKNAAVLKKRALQFGSRIANSKENAHDISPRL